MKPTMAISVCVLAAGLAVAQNPSVVQNTRATMNAVRDTTAAASNVALGGQPSSTTSQAHTALKAGGPAVTAQVSKGAQPPVGAHAHHARKMRHTVTAEKSTGPKTEPVAQNPMAQKMAQKTAEETAQNQKKIGEIVGSPAPTAADGTSPDDATASSKYNSNGKRDPFISPVVAHVGGPSCATGKKCLEIGAINLRGVVHAESGFIAVVSNSLNKAYFLRENDPVFNGYVVRITGDSIVFQETLQDRLGKTFTREVTKKITVPAV